MLHFKVDIKLHTLFQSVDPDTRGMAHRFS